MIFLKLVSFLDSRNQRVKQSLVPLPVIDLDKVIRHEGTFMKLVCWKH